MNLVNFGKRSLAILYITDISIWSLEFLGQDMGNGSEYVLNLGNYYFEILKLNSDEPAEPGRLGIS